MSSWKRRLASLDPNWSLQEPAPTLASLTIHAWKRFTIPVPAAWESMSKSVFSELHCVSFSCVWSWMRICWQIWLISVVWWQLEPFPPHLNTPTWSPPPPINPCGEQGACTDHKVKENTGSGFIVLCRATCGVTWFHSAEPASFSTAKACDPWTPRAGRCSMTSKTGWTLPSFRHFREDPTTTPSLGWLSLSDRCRSVFGRDI